jgi:hypothetical protein
VKGGKVKLIVLFSKQIHPHLNNIFDVRIISEESYNNFQKPVIVVKAIENISQKWG